jgi:hypothetical protein
MVSTMSYIDVKQEFDHVLEQVLSTATPIQFEFKGKTLTISVIETLDKLDCLEPHPDCLVGDPEAIVHLDWSGEVHHDLP